MRTRHTELFSSAGGDSHLAAGFSIVRDNFQYIFRDIKVSGGPNFLSGFRKGINYEDSLKSPYWSGDLGKNIPCGSDYNTNMPFSMAGGTHNSRGGEDSVSGSRLMFLAPFGRYFPTEQVWTLANRVDEPKRHAFAVRTCTGCHSAETGTQAFHILPRLANQNSQLSPFLTGGPKSQFIYNGTTYKYDELEKRRQWLQDALEGKAELFESLIRHD